MVYVVQEPAVRYVKDAKGVRTGHTTTLDLTSAGKFGEMSVLLPDGDVVLSTDRWINRLKTMLAKFSDDDYLLLIGDPVAIGMAVAVASQRNQGRVKVLRWARHAVPGHYVPVSMNFNREDI